MQVHETFFQQVQQFKSVYGIEKLQRKEKGYEIIRKTIDNPFPTHTWIALSVCVPLVPIFFIVFLIPAFEDV